MSQSNSNLKANPQNPTSQPATNHLATESTATTIRHLLSACIADVDRLIAILSSALTGRAAILEAYPEINTDDDRAPDQRILQGAKRRQDDSWEKVPTNRATSEERLNYVEHFLIKELAENVRSTLSVDLTSDECAKTPLNSAHKLIELIDTALVVSDFYRRQALPA